ncbi:hypothetical protein COCON_G00023240 [Conger conger]|uniref:Armadillo repeat-containing protein 7 n=1 Tax=Conger conger TaxID=82655 RepID=A0A9Q1DXA4_CONCO|nr:hypothetical protein COCON_G00023240 [Conger conger]
MSGRGRFPGPDRFEYLQALVTEFQDTDSSEAREQVLANLANFSYDPRNMEDLLRLQVTELFLDMLTEESENLVEFGIGGLCNLSVVPACRDQVLQSDGVALVTGCLSSRREETVLSAIGTLMNLATAAAWRTASPTPPCCTACCASPCPRAPGCAAWPASSCRTAAPPRRGRGWPSPWFWLHTQDRALERLHTAPCHWL